MGGFSAKDTVGEHSEEKTVGRERNMAEETPGEKEEFGTKEGGDGKDWRKGMDSCGAKEGASGKDWEKGMDSCGTKEGGDGKDCGKGMDKRGESPETEAGLAIEILESRDLTTAEKEAMGRSVRQVTAMEEREDREAKARRIQFLLRQIIQETVRESGEETASVLFSGDVGFFSGAKKLLPLLAGLEVRCIPGISSMAYFCARLGLSYEEVHAVSLHGRTSAVALPVRLHERCFFLLGGEVTAAQVCLRLCEYGLGDVTVHIGENLGYTEEKIVSGRTSELLNYAGERLAVLVTDNPGHLRHLPTSIPDDAFTRARIPMTKSVVRGAAVSALQIEEDSVCYDIGCGTGSVSVEMAFRCPRGRVLAFDKKPEAAALTLENARHFGCDNITVTEGTCPDCLTDAPAPDKVFIGGSTGRMRDIFDCISAKNPAADIALTAVSLETLHEAQDCFAAYQVSCQITQIAVTETERIGSHTMLRAQSPVLLIEGRLS